MQRPWQSAIYSSNYQTSMLKVYIDLRDPAAKGFHHASMGKSLLTHVATIEAPQEPTLPTLVAWILGADNHRCSQCKNKEVVHTLLGLLPFKTCAS
jgi:hypothetical protein